MAVWLTVLLLTASVLSLSVNGLNDTVKAKLEALSTQLSGDIFFTGQKYDKGNIMKNTRYNTEFGAVAIVKTTEDVSKLLKFCDEYKLQPTVRSSGHDYFGRAARDGSLNINLSEMKSMSINRNDPLNGGGPTITVGPGLTWGEIYKYVYKQGPYLVVGGSAQTVSPGGYTQGGGHSPLTPKLGLAVDNTLQFTIVTPDGSIITTGENGGTIQSPTSSSSVGFTDTDLYWAVLGGGGSTFGVVTSFTYKLHNPPAGGFAQIYMVYGLSADGYNTGEELIWAWQNIALTSFDENWSGYVIVSPGEQNIVGFKVVGFLSFSFLHWGGYASGLNVIRQMESIRPERRLRYTVTNHSDFYDYEKNVNDPTGFRTYIQNTFVQRKDIMESRRLAGFMSSLYKVQIDDAAPVCTMTLLGGPRGKAYSLRGQNKNSVSSNFRESYGSLSCGIGWDDANRDYDIVAAYRASELGEITDIGKGTYLNEADACLDDWKTDYWGNQANYNRLLNVKMRYDRNNMFWCRHCVGSDLVDQPDGYSPEPCAAPPAHLWSPFCLLFNAVLVYVLY